MPPEEVLQPACYKRHEQIDSHISEGKFWRGVIVTAVLSGITILIAQYNMSIQNTEKLTNLNSKIATMVDINTKRLDTLETFVYRQGK